jgi:hypothetical protein
MNKRKNRQEQIRDAAKYTSAKNIESFEGGAKWADYHPYWQEGIPKPELNQYGLPKLYLCQILTLDMTFGYRYSYRVGFVTLEDKPRWNCENSNTKVMRYLDIYCNESDSQLIQKDIPTFEGKDSEEDEEDGDNKKDYKLAA